MTRRDWWRFAGLDAIREVRGTLADDDAHLA